MKYLIALFLLVCLIGELISMLMNVSACLIILNFCLAR